MHMRKSLWMLFFLAIATFIFQCSSGNNKDAGNLKSETTPRSNNGGQSNSAGGLTWQAPSAWKIGQPQQMRVVTYIIPAETGNADNAECAVFHFPGTGGDKESNLQRWASQFEQPDGRNSADVAIIKEMESNALKITTIDLNGIYKVTGGPMMEVRDKKLGYALKGAIIEGPQGPVFFKMVGPEKTVKASGDRFSAMIKSAKAGA